MQTYINPLKQNNDHARIMDKIRFCSSFKVARAPVLIFYAFFVPGQLTVIKQKTSV